MEKTYDLSDIDTATACEGGAVLHLVHPTTGAKLGMTITLAGTDSPTYVQAQRALVNKRMRSRGAKLTADQIDEDNADLIAACVLDWTGVVEKGAALDCTRANAKSLFLRFPWVKEQASEFMSDRANFLRD